MRWNRYRFENTIAEECEVAVTLETRNDDLFPVIISDEIKILPIQGTPNPEFNPKIEFLNGPYWEFTESAAVASYRVESLNIDAVKNFLKEQTASERWSKENSGISISLNGVDRSFPSDKETRNVIQSHISAGLETVNWKFNRDDWIALTQQDLQTVLTAVLAHVQESFNWEMAKCAEIDSCTTLTELDAVVIKEENTDGVI
jgi:hypothetical protein